MASGRPSAPSVDARGRPLAAALPSRTPPPPAKREARAPKRGRPRGKFTQHRRVDRLLETLEAHPAGITLEDLATMLRITTRSVRRYLKELKDGKHVALESLATAPGGAHVWRIKPSERGRSLNLRRTQAYALLATRRCFDVLRGSALYDELDGLFKQLDVLARRPSRAAVRGEIPSDLLLEERLLYLPSGESNYAGRGEDIDKLFLAVAELRELHFRPRPPRARPAPPRLPGDSAFSEPARSLPPPAAPPNTTVWPLGLVVDRGVLKCVALPEGGGALRVLLLDEMLEVTLGERGRYGLPEGFALRTHLEGTFGVGARAARTPVLVEFDPKTAERIRARKVHPSQRVATAPDGRLRVSMEVADLDEVRAWVLGFGEGARVIAPPELVRAVQDSLRAALDRYE